MFPPCSLSVLSAVWPDKPSPCVYVSCLECCESMIYMHNKISGSRYLTKKEIQEMFVTDPVERMAIEIHDTN